jgi:hypothetical protein
VKALLYEHTVNTKKELLQRILSVARNIDTGAAFRKVTSFLVTWARKSFQAVGRHFKQMA